MRGSKVLDGDLSWLWNSAEGELGKRAAALEPTIRGSRDESGVGDDKREKAAQRYREITDALHTLTHDDQKVLRLAHTLVPPAEHSKYERLRDCAELAAVAAHIVGVELPRILARKGADGVKGVDDLKRKVVARVSGAVSRYRETKRSQGVAESDMRSIRERRKRDSMLRLKAA